MQNTARWGGRMLLTGIALMTAGQAAAQQLEGLSGTINAAHDQNVMGLVLLVCDLDRGPDCPIAEAQRFRVGGTKASSTRFSVSVPSNRAGYAVTVWQDTNGSGQMDLGDQMGIYFRNNESVTPVIVPAAQVTVNMVVTGRDKAQPSPAYVSRGGANAMPTGESRGVPAMSAGAAGRTPPGIGALAGEWGASGQRTESHYGPKLSRSYTGLPAGRQMGVVGTGQVGTYAWGVTYGYQNYLVTRNATLQLQANGALNWTSVAEIKRSEDCFSVTQMNMSGIASMQGGQMVVDIANGHEETTYRGCPGANAQPQSQSLAGKQYRYDVKLSGGDLLIRQTQPASSTAGASVTYQRR